MAEKNERTNDLPRDMAPRMPLPGEEPPVDSSLQEENTLSACLMKILQKKDSEEETDSINADENCPVFDSEDMLGFIDGDYPPDLTGTRPKTRHCQSSLDVNDSNDESEFEKLRKWREAGVALRKALSEQSSDSVARTPSSMSSSFRGGNDDPMNLMLDDYMSGPFGPVLAGDICNSAPDSAEALDPNMGRENSRVLSNSTKPITSHSKKHSKYPRKSDSQDISQGLAEVREKIKKITSRISTSGNIPLKSQTSNKPSKCVARSRGLSSKTDSSSSESEDAVVPKRHKYVHKSNRTRSSSRSPKTNNTPPGSFREKRTANHALSSQVRRGVTCNACGGLLEKNGGRPNLDSKLNIPVFPRTNTEIDVSTKTSRSSEQTSDNSNSASKKDQLKTALASADTDEDLPNLVSSSEDETSQRGLEEALKNMRKDCEDEHSGDMLPHLSSSEEKLEDEITNKLRCLANQGQKNHGNRLHHPLCKAYLCSCKRNTRARDSVETEPHLADVESSVHSGDSALLESEDFLGDKERSLKTISADIKTSNPCDCNNVAHCHLCGELYSDTHWFEPSLDDIDIPADCSHSFLHAENTTPYTSHADDEDTFECSHGDDLDDLADLDLGTRSNSECEDEKIELDQQEIDDLPGLVVSSSDDVSGGEADDEFECDCPVCQRHRRLYDDEWVTDEDQEGHRGQQGDSIQYTGNGTRESRIEMRDTMSQPLSINMEELTPLDLIFMQLREGGRQEFLELMFHNVIMQMLSVYPDLLGDQAPPPAPPTMVNNLPVKKIDRKVEEDSTCPICLCAFEDGEEARELPCKHLFHLMCIQMWLNKSGTCPVCRHVLTRTSPT